MADALENAYLVILGQIVVVATAIFFGVPYFLSTGDGASALADPVTLLFVIFVFAACTMMIINIIIGWSALRSATRRPEFYTNRMFIIDVVTVVVFFAMNNVIVFAFGNTLALQDTAAIKKVVVEGVKIETVSSTAAALYLLTAVFLLLCKAWNKTYYKVAGRSGTTHYEVMLWVVIGACASCAAGAIAFSHSIGVQVATFAVWIICWLYINGHWLIHDFMREPASAAGNPSSGVAAPTTAVAVAPSGSTLPASPAPGPGGQVP